MGDWLFAVGLGLWGSVPVGLGSRVIAWGLFPVGRDDDLRLGTRLLRWVLGLLRLSHHLGLIPINYRVSTTKKDGIRNTLGFHRSQ